MRESTSATMAARQACHRPVKAKEVEDARASPERVINYVSLRSWLM